MRPVGDGLFLKKGCVIEKGQRILQFRGDIIPSTTTLTSQEDGTYAIKITNKTILQCRKYAENGNITTTKRRIQMNDKQ
jgi:hypothetical protein